MYKAIKKDKSLDKKNAFLYSMGFGLYCLTSLVFLIIVTRINGIDDAGIFSFGFSFATMIQMFATYAGRTFQVTEQNKNVWDSDFLIFKILTCLTMVIFGVLFCSLRLYDTYKFLVIFILILYKALDAFSESIFGIFQKHNNLWQCGISMTLKSLLCFTVFFIIDIFTKNLLVSLLSLFAADMIVFLFYDCRLAKKYRIKFHRLKFITLKYLLISGFAVFAVSLLTQYLIMAQKFAIDFIMDHETQAIFGIVIMPATFLSMCASMIINPFLYKLNKEKNKMNYKAFNKIVIKVINYVIVVGIITIVICYFVGIPILSIIYGINLNDYLLPLLIIVFGSVSGAIVAVISNSMIALRKNVSQMIIYIIAAVFTSIISYCLIKFYDLYGGAVAYCLTMLFLLVLYIVEYVYVIKKLQNGK